MKTVLSVDGGGIRGLVPALALVAIQKACGRPLHELFDLVGGTSTGGIIALCIGAGIPANEIAALYEKRGPKIFNRSWLAWLLSPFSLTRCKYSERELEKALADYFQSRYISEAQTNVFVTAYETWRHVLFFLRSYRGKTDPSRNFLMTDAARATSAAPTYFPPKLAKSQSGESYGFIDGGVTANNPTLCAILEAYKLWPGEGLFVLSLGTGDLVTPILARKARYWGLAEWARPLMDIMFHGVSKLSDFQAGHFGLAAEYYRLQPQLTPETEGMDNTSRDNLDALALIAEQMISENAEKVKKICKRLREIKG